MEQLIKEGYQLEKKLHGMHQTLDEEINKLIANIKQTRDNLSLEKKKKKKETLKRKASESDLSPTHEDAIVNKVQSIVSSSSSSSSSSISSVRGSLPEPHGKIPTEEDFVWKELNELSKSIHLSSSITKSIKSYHSTLSKYGKSIDKIFPTDIEKIYRSNVQPSPEHLNTWILQHLQQNGQFETAQAFEQESQIQPSLSFYQEFKELYSILHSLEKQEIEPALTWILSEKRLDLKNQQKMEFELRKLQFLKHCQEQKFQDHDMLTYIQSHFPKFSKQSIYQIEIQRLMGCLAYVDRLNNSPYTDFFHPKHWEKLKQLFMETCCSIHEIPSKSCLSLCLSAGLLALPQLKKMYHVVENSTKDWLELKELPVQVKLPKEYSFHSIFVCPISKEQTSKENPPMILKCGHVICKGCIDRIEKNSTSSRTTSKFKCPTCPTQQRRDDTRELHF